MKFKQLLQCKIFGFHNWTCNAEQKIRPTELELRAGIFGFFLYSRMYCSSCGKRYRSSIWNDIITIKDLEFAIDACVELEEYEIAGIIKEKIEQVKCKNSDSKSEK